MEEFRYRQDEIIFHEGDEAHHAFYIAEGEVEIRIGPDAEPQTLAVLKEGEILGEMALVADHPRSATAVAGERGARLIVISETFFVEKIVGDPKQVRALLATLAERLRNADALIRSARIHGGESSHVEDFLAASEESQGRASGDAPGLRLESDYDPRLEMRPFEIEVGQNPFRIGRYFKSLDGLFFSHADLVIEDDAPFQVSRVHCDLFWKGGRWRLKDRGSRLGTIVNGVSLGAGAEASEATLEAGRNQIVLGESYSPHRLTAIVGE